jgi:hypothetical protein
MMRLQFVRRPISKAMRAISPFVRRTGGGVTFGGAIGR